MAQKEIEKFIIERKDWIDEHIGIMRQRSETEKEAVPFTAAELDKMSEYSLEKVTSRAEHYSALMGVSYNKINVRRQVSRWGSCSSRKNLNFNCLLALVPDYVLDYVVVHELCHLKEMNHSENFWREVECVIPDYKARRNWLRNNGEELIHRLRISIHK